MPRVELTVCERCGRLFRAAPGVHVCPRCNPPPVVRTPVDLDQFGAFLVDVDQDVYDLDNWKTKKSGRVIDAKDASAILAFYSKMSTSATDAQETWNEVLANYGRKEKIQDFLMK